MKANRDGLAGFASSRLRPWTVRGCWIASVSVLLLAGCATGETSASGERPSPPELPPPSMDRPPGAGADASPGRTGDEDRGEIREGDRVEQGPGGLLQSELPIRGGVLPELEDAAALLPRVRALWVVRTALVHPDSARAAVIRAHRAGFNTLLVQVRGRGDAWYRSGREPRAEPLTGAHPAYDPLAVLLSEARARDMEVHAWINVHFVAGAYEAPVDELHLVHRRPELLAVPRALASRLYAMDPRSLTYRDALMEYAREHREQVEGLYTSPVLPQVTDHLEAVVTELVGGYDLDGLHLDYIRFPSREFDYGRPALEALRARLRATRPPAELRGAEVAWNQGEVFAYVDAFPDAWDDFRRDGVTSTVRRLGATARSLQPGIAVTAAVFPDPADAYRRRLQAWEEWLELDLVDVVASMNYAAEEQTFRSALERARAAGGPDRVWIGIGAFSNSFADAVRQGCLVRSEGMAGLALFSYDWTVGPDGRRAAAGGEYLDDFALQVFPASGAAAGSEPGAVAKGVPGAAGVGVCGPPPSR